MSRTGAPPMQTRLLTESSTVVSLPLCPPPLAVRMRVPLKVAVWSCSVALGTWVLCMVGGYFLAATGLFLTIGVAVVNYVVVGDVVP